MSTGDRLLLLLVAIFLMAIAIGVVMLGLNFGLAVNAVYSLLQEFFFGRWEAALVGGVILLIGLRLIYLALAGRKPLGALVTRSELGEVSITVPAVENLVKQTAGQIEGIREVRPTVTARTDGVAIRLKAWVEKDINVPELAVQIQETLRSHLKEVVGLNTATINVEVQDVGSEQTLKPRPAR